MVATHFDAKLCTAQRDICTAPKLSARCVWGPSHLSPCTAPALPLHCPCTAPGVSTFICNTCAPAGPEQGRSLVNLGKWEGVSLFS